MDPDEIARLVNVMKLDYQNPHEAFTIEDEDIRIGAERLSCCLVAKILPFKVINEEAFRQQMPRILQSERKIIIEAAGDNLFIFEFCSQRDRTRILQEGPWNFSRSLIVLTEPTGCHSPRTLRFDEATFWIQLHNIPLAFLHENLLLKLGSQLGMVVEVDRGDHGVVLGCFARIRVCINISQPLRKCIRVTSMSEEEDIFIILVYERLPDFCYACGRVGHTHRECEDTSVDKVRFACGAWLRAAAHVSRTKDSKESGTKPNTEKNVASSQNGTEEIGNQNLVVVPPTDQIRGGNGLSNGGNFGSQGKEDDRGHIQIEGDGGRLVNMQSKVLLSMDPHVLEEESGSRNISVEAGAKCNAKHWKHLAREKGKEKVTGLNSLHYVGSKRALLEDDDGLSRESASPIKKRARPGDERVSSCILPAVVAMQPRQPL
ncbi:uncharacterized protein LOC142553940 [Primulina tabacum]|uniref:uncharacterized protein LOC142553940 n=1 Tax=Primulina tabacum TaxID=48773 RepID=UPI003F5A2218